MADNGHFRLVDNTLPGIFPETPHKLYIHDEEPLSVVILRANPGVSPEDISEKELFSALPSDAAGSSMILIAWRTQDEAMFLFKSRTGKVRAQEFLQVLCTETGLVHGDAQSATGRCTIVNLLVDMEEADQEELTGFILANADAYFKDCDVIEAASYSEAHRDELISLARYTKKRVAWSYVLADDIAPAGTLIRIRTLENESGTELVTDPGIVIMIGIQGEVYHMDRSKFEKTYEATDEPFDIFAQMTQFIPEACILPGESYVSLDELAHICYPRPGGEIYARQLTRRVKIFPSYSPDEYFSGDAGDYMAVRSDDISDIYVIRKAIFRQTYEEVAT